MVHQETNDFEKALDYYNQSLKIAKKINNKNYEKIILAKIKFLKKLKKIK